MYAAPGVGLAAVQVGVPRRLVVLDTAKDDEPPQPLVLINPEIVALGSKTRVHEEGCLSIPDVRIDIERPATVTVRYLDRDGQGAGTRSRGPARNRHTARDRSLERQADHRLPVAAEARHNRAQVQEAGERRRGMTASAAIARVEPRGCPQQAVPGGEGSGPVTHAHRLHGHARFRAFRRSRRSWRPGTRSLPSTRSRRDPPDAAWPRGSRPSICWPSGMGVPRARPGDA